MYHLIYVSYASVPLSEDDLRSLLSVSMSNNEKLGVTGMLLYIERKFIQVLEGDEPVVKDLFDKICRDARHEKIAIILEGESKERIFKDWSMGFKALSIEEFRTLSGYHDIDDFFQQESISNESHPAYIFLRLFYDKNQRDFKELVTT